MTVSRGASKINGTSADLREGDTLSLNQLFYGMMLPSGNDAAFLLAEYFGSLLRTSKYHSCDIKYTTNNNTASAFVNHPTIRHFLVEMNIYAKELGLKDTYYDSPHGLMNRNNYSTAFDICHLINECMKNPIFREVVGTATYETKSQRS